MTAKTKIEQAIELLRQALDELDVPAPDPDPEPPEDFKVYTVDVPKTNAWCVRELNKNGRPVMQIYPEDTAPVSERIQFLKGVQIEVDEDPVKADGGRMFYRITEDVPVDDQLYLRSDHGTVV